MIVFVESNFVLELALKQGEFNEANQLLGLAETSKIEIAVPAFSLVEPRYKLIGERRERRNLQGLLERQLEQMVRSQGFGGLREQSNALLAALATKADIDTRQFETIVLRLASCAVVLPMSRETIQAGMARQLLDLEPQDALVFASIQEYLKANPGVKAIFANRDKKGFLAKTVAVDLAALGCKVIPTFSGAFEYVTNQLAQQTSE